MAADTYSNTKYQYSSRYECRLATGVQQEREQFQSSICLDVVRFQLRFKRTTKSSSIAFLQSNVMITVIYSYEFSHFSQHYTSMMKNKITATTKNWRSVLNVSKEVPLSAMNLGRKYEYLGRVRNKIQVRIEK